MNLATLPPLDLDAFNDRDRAILRCLARGWPTDIIATELGYSYGYIKTQTWELSHRVGVQTRTQLAVLAWHAGLGQEPISRDGGQLTAAQTARHAPDGTQRPLP